MDEITISPFLPEHIDSIVRLAEECGLAPWSKADYADDLGRPDSISFRIAGDKDETIGFVIGRIIASAVKIGSFDAELYNIGISRVHRNRGLGSELMTVFQGECREKKAGSIFLEVRVSNQNAIAFYKKKGFTVVATRKNFYSSPTEDAFVMQVSLNT